MATVFKTKNEMQPKTVIAALEQGLRKSLALRFCTQLAHWNVKGPSFIALHELFDKIQQEVATAIDLLAERVVQLNVPVTIKLQDMEKTESLNAAPIGFQEGDVYVKFVTEHIQSLTGDLRKGIELAAEQGDMVSSEILTEITRNLDKAQWLVESHLPRK